MARIIITEGDPQPTDCPRCESKEGYQISERLIKNYYYFHDADGSPDGGDWGEFGKLIYKDTTCYCRNCGSKLGFKLKK